MIQSSDTIEIIKDKLTWVQHDESISVRSLARENTITFVNDKTMVYTSFFADFGPLDLGLMYKFCVQLQETMQKAKDAHKSVVYYTTNSPHMKSNCAVLLCGYMILVLNATVEQAYAPFIGMNPQFTPFRDAGFCINTFPINVLDCARAMRRAKNLGHFNFRNFSLANFQNMAKMQNGDLSWIIPGKFIAFSGPITKRRQIGPKLFTLTPEEYVPVLKNLGVTCVVRFNSKCYDRNVFLMNGIRHVDLFYEDGGNPSDAILQSFLQICENEKGAIAVHCKAGLGRTGTNIAAYMMKHWGYTAKESTAWCRLCRPGSVVGPQQQYLAGIELRMTAEGNVYRERHNIPPLHTHSNGNGHQQQQQQQSDMMQLVSGVNNLHANSNDSGNSHQQSSSINDGRVSTPPLFNNRRDVNANSKQPVESLFQKSTASRMLNGHSNGNSLSIGVANNTNRRLDSNTSAGPTYLNINNGSSQQTQQQSLSQQQQQQQQQSGLFDTRGYTGPGGGVASGGGGGRMRTGSDLDSMLATLGTDRQQQGELQQRPSTSAGIIEKRDGLMTGYAMQRHQMQTTLQQQQQQQQQQSSLRVGSGGPNTNTAIAATTDKLLLSLAPSGGNYSSSVRPNTSHGTAGAVQSANRTTSQGFAYNSSNASTSGTTTAAVIVGASGTGGNGRSISVNRTLSGRHGTSESPQAAALRSVQESSAHSGGLTSTHNKSANNVLSLSNAKITVTSSLDFERQPRGTSHSRLGSAHRHHGHMASAAANAGAGGGASGKTLRESVDLSPYQTTTTVIGRPKTAVNVGGGRMARL